MYPPTGADKISCTPPQKKQNINNKLKVGLFECSGSYHSGVCLAVYESIHVWAPGNRVVDVVVNDHVRSNSEYFVEDYIVVFFSAAVR